MAYIFRLQKDGSKNTINGWKSSSIYGVSAIGKIEDPNGASAKKQITSIPSPFARMDLVKTAFRTVSQKDANGQFNLDGDTIFHKMVSDTLDVAEIFFEYDKHRNKVEIIPWDIQNDLQELLQSGDSAHRQLGATYDLFLKQDENSYNFKELKRIYLLNYKNGKDPLNIIGATSPATLFFCSANDFSYIKDIVFGKDQPFDDKYLPLYKRDPEFHRYLWNLSKSTEFATLFPEVNDYLQACYTQSDSQRKQVLQACTGDLTAYNPINVGDNDGERVEIFGTIELKQMRPTLVAIAQQSDFVISSQIYNGDNLPLVLPVDTFTQNYIYVRDPWDKNTKVPYSDSTLWKNRSLPDDGTQYPYLTISDFLEDYMIASDSEMTAENRKIYFDGNSDDTENGYLLPIKDLFFEFFTTEDLINGINGTKLIELKKNAGGITVILRIPIKSGRFIEYRRNYFYQNEPQIDSNKGAIVNRDFAFAMLPNIKFNNASQAFYRMGLLYRPTDTSKYDIECKYQGNNVPTAQYIRNANDQRYPKGYAIAVEQSNFDYVRLRLQCKGDDKNREASGIIVPKFQSEVGTKKFTFAIDFGTTNTHVAYRVNEDPIYTFDVTKDDRQIYPFANYGNDYQFVFDADFMPELIGNGRYKFPMRTALNEAANTNWKQPVYPMLQANLAFTYEKLIKYEYNDVNTTLKWSTDLNNEEEVKCYIYSLMLLLRNKVLLNGGSLENTRIVWFYPISMIKQRQKLFKKAWQDAYTKYFSNNENELEENKNELEKRIYGMTESLAPYELYKKSEGLNNVVTIDIGGGTTDVVMAEAGQVKCITSFRFAADAIFGDAFCDNNSSQNGIVRQFKQTLKDILHANKESKLLEVYQQLDSANCSADFASFLFSLKNNVEKEKANLVDFNKIMQYDSTQKMSFIFFYAAIIYHIAHIMKAKELNMPRHIAFSGNGSKVISILSTDSATLEDFTKIIFEKVFESKYPKDGLTIHMGANPKEITCKGGLLCNPNQIDKEGSVTDKRRVILDSADLTKVSPLSHLTYKAIADDKDYKDKTVEQVEMFINFVFKLDDEFSFCNNFGIDTKSLSIAKKECYRDLLAYLDNGIRLYGGESTDDEDKGVEVEETLFFYPLIGMLHTLADAICNNQK